jgi:uncharacterized protein (DUF362 family)
MEGTMNAVRVGIESCEGHPDDTLSVLENVIAFTGRSPSPGEHWVVKPNLTYPTYLPGAVNSPRFLDAFARFAADHRIRLTFVEGDGGNASYTALDAFEGNGFPRLAERYGVEYRSLTAGRWTYRETVVAGRRIRLPYSEFLLRRQFDRFITAPVLKNHVFTVVSLGLKNLWGCIPDPYRMYYHHKLDAGIVALGIELKPDFAVVDATTGMRGSGPIDGEPCEVNLLIASETAGAGDVACLELLGIPISAVGHLSLAASEGLLPDAGLLKWSRPVDEFARHDFVMKRPGLARVSIILANHPRWQRMVYHSKASRSIYRCVRLLRGPSAQSRLAARPRIDATLRPLSEYLR